MNTKEGAIFKHLKKDETTSTALTSRLVVEDLEQEHDVLAADNIADKTKEVIQEKGEDQEMIHFMKQRCVDSNSKYQSNAN